MRQLLRDFLALALRCAPLIGLFTLFALAQPSNAVTLVNSLVLEVNANNQVTVVSSGSTVPIPSDTVVRVGSFPLMNGWGVSSGEANWFDPVAHVLRLNSSGVFVPVDNRVSSTFVTGSVTITGSTELGAALRQSLGIGAHSFASTAAQGTIPYVFSGAVTIAPANPVISGVQLEVDSTDAVTVVSSGGHVPFGDVGVVGDFDLRNGWGVVSNFDVLIWTDGGSPSVEVASLDYRGMHVPIGGEVASATNFGLMPLTGSPTLGAALRSQLGEGASMSFQSVVAQSSSTSFVIAGQVTIVLCGNEALETGEECDDGNMISGDGCSDVCLAEFCGDTVIQAGLGEQCDDGNLISEDGCSDTCLIESCGDAVVQAGLGEECDDENMISGDGCSDVCLIESCNVPQNPVANCSFESGFTSWITKDMVTPFVALAVSPAETSITGLVPWLTAPTDGGSSATHGFDGGGPDTIEVSQEVVVPPGAQLTFTYRAGWDLVTFCGGCTLARTFSVVVEPSGGGAPLQSTDVLTVAPQTQNPDTGTRSGSVDLSAFDGQAVRLKFAWDVPESSTGPAAFEIDNILMTGGVAVPALGRLTLGFLILLISLVGMRGGRNRPGPI
jgi:cysteine-rich repeat protein